MFRSLLVTLLAMFSLSSVAAPKVLVTLKPIHALVAAVMHGVAEPALLLPEGSSPHSFQLKPSSLKLLQQANLIIWVGPQLEVFMIKPLSQFAPSLGTVALMALPDLTILPLRHGRAWETQHHHENHNHHHEGVDPHIWLSTDNAMVIVNFLAAYLSEQDKSHAAQYQRNAAALKLKLSELKIELMKELAPVSMQPFLVYHDGYQYFDAEFKLNAVGTISLNPHLPLSAHALNKVRQQVKLHDIHCVFRETEFNDPMLAQHLAQFNLKVAELDPLGDRQLPGPMAYENIMRQLAHTFKTCLSD